MDFITGVLVAIVFFGGTYWTQQSLNLCKKDQVNYEQQLKDFYRDQKMYKASIQKYKGVLDQYDKNNDVAK